MSKSLLVIPAAKKIIPRRKAVKTPAVPQPLFLDRIIPTARGEAVKSPGRVTRHGKFIR
jgi:hypothetical protein